MKFANNIRKPRKTRGKARIKDDDDALDTTELEDFESSSSNLAIPDKSSGQLHQDQEDMRWSVVPGRDLIEEDDVYLSSDLYMTVGQNEQKVMETSPSTPSTPMSPIAMSKKKLKMKLKDLSNGIGSPLEITKKKKKSVSEESRNDKKKGKKKKTKDTVSRFSFFKNSLYYSGSLTTRNADANSLQELATKSHSNHANPDPKELDRMAEQRDFSDVFNAIEAEKSDLTLAQNRQEQQEYTNKLVNDLQECETMLEQERTELFMVKTKMNEEAQKNEELQGKIQQLQHLLDNAGEAAQLDELREKNRMLEIKAQLLLEKTERQQETISTMMNCKSQTASKPSHANRQMLLQMTGSLTLVEEDNRSSNSHRPLQTSRSFNHITRHDGESMDFSMFIDDDNDQSEWGEQSGFSSISSLPAKAQGELLQLRSTLRIKNKALEEKDNELAQVKQDLELLKEEQGVKNLTSYVENLENEKKFFVSKIDKLKKELEESRKRESEESSIMEPNRSSSLTSPKQAEDHETGYFSWHRVGARMTFSTDGESSHGDEDDKLKNIANDLKGTLATTESVSKVETDARKQTKTRLKWGVLQKF